MTILEDAQPSTTTWDEEEQQRPAKKRRFFVENSPDKPVVRDDIVEHEPPIAPQDSQVEDRLSALRKDGFDIDMIETVVGKKLDDDTLYSLYSLANKNVETGRSAACGASCAVH